MGIGLILGINSLTPLSSLEHVEHNNRQPEPEKEFNNFTCLLIC